MSTVTIILSSPRSGSSWLSRVVRCVPDHSVFTHNTFTTQFLYTLYPLRSANPWGDDSIKRSRLLDRWRIGRVRSHIESRADGKPIVLISPTLSNFLPILSQAFPEAQYVHFQRNPFDTVASMKKFMAKNNCGGFWDRYREHAYGGRVFATRGALVHSAHRLRWMRLIHPGYLGLRPGGFQSASKLSMAEFLTWYYCANQRDIVAGLEQIPDERKLGIHYESLVENFDEVSSTLLRFMTRGDGQYDIPRPHDGVRTGAVGRRSQFFDDSELETVRDFLLAHAPPQVLEPYGIRPEVVPTKAQLIAQAR